MEPPARAELVIDLDAIEHNVATLVATCAPAVVMVVVKADGYGHGMVPVARAARRAGAAWLGVATPAEAHRLRAGGDQGRLLCWLNNPGDDVSALIAAEVDLTAYSLEEIERFAAAGQGGDLIPRVQLKVDTGLSRGGATLAQWPEVVAAAERAQQAGLIEVTGVWSHFACADEPDHPANDLQHERFDAAVRIAGRLEPDIVHLANSAAALTRPSARYDLVRCGLATYGLSPAPTVADPRGFDLRPAMSAQVPVASVKPVPAHEGISYGHLAITETDTTVALVPVGYGEGIPVAASNRAQVLISGQRRTISGRVCMDQFVIDLDGLTAAAGDRVLLFGPGDEGEPTAQDWAEACKTINYEIVTRMGGRFARRYLPDSRSQA